MNEQCVEPFSLLAYWNSKLPFPWLFMRWRTCIVWSIRRYFSIGDTSFWFFKKMEDVELYFLNFLCGPLLYFNHGWSLYGRMTFQNSGLQNPIINCVWRCLLQRFSLVHEAICCKHVLSPSWNNCTKFSSTLLDIGHGSVLQWLLLHSFRLWSNAGLPSERRLPELIYSTSSAEPCPVPKFSDATIVRQVLIFEFIGSESHDSSPFGSC